jgi:RNA polymerase sigma-70 factor (ECF subfamily)
MVSKGPVPNPRAFLYVVTKHLIIDWYRRSKATSLEALSKDEERPFDPVDARAHLDIETSSEAKRVINLIDQLGEQYRDVVYLRFVEDLPPREIAERLKLKVNVVSVRITRGLEALRKLAGIDKLE